MYRPENDGLRALAVLAVIARHFAHQALPSGYLGVDIFSLISGFVITASLALPASWSWPRRLLPALLVCVLVTNQLVCFFDTRPTVSLQSSISALFGLANVTLHHQSVDYFALGNDLSAFLHIWLLGVEEQFYFA